MNTQDAYLIALDRFREIAQGVDIETQVAEDYRARVAEFKILIPLVGSFNAGKTSLVNAYLEREGDQGLPTDIVPQTALATEIHYASSSADEGVELYGEADKFLKQVDIGEFKQLEKEALTAEKLDAQYAKAMLHAATLRNNDRKVLVDMPGLDSGLRTHNAAIQRYLPLGSYFILVVDAEHGALRDSEICQLREFLEQEVEFAVLINKSEKKKTGMEAIVNHIREQVHQSFGDGGMEAVVQPVSAHEKDVAAFQQVVEAVDFHRALRGYWRLRILGLFGEAIMSLHTRYSALNVSSADGERMIEDLQGKKEALEEKFQRDEREIKERYSDRAVDRILREVRRAIVNDAASLAQIGLDHGEQACGQAINERVRQTLNRLVDKESAGILQEMVEHYQEEIDDINVHYQEFISSGEDGGLHSEQPDTTRLLIDAGKKSWAAIGDIRRPDTRSNGTLYTTISGILAATTKIVAPWLEVVIILMPQIIGWISKWNEEERRQEQRQNQLLELKSRIANSVAPGVASKLRGDIARDYDVVAKEMLAKLREAVQRAIDKVQQDINKSRAEIEGKRLNVEQRRAQLHAAVKELTKAKEPLEEG